MCVCVLMSDYSRIEVVVLENLYKCTGNLALAAESNVVLRLRQYNMRHLPQLKDIEE